MDKIIHHMAAATWTRYGKWRVELEIVGEPKRIAWLSAAQYDFLSSAFEHTKNGYSDSRCTVVGQFSDDGRYQRCWARVPFSPPKPEHATPLVQRCEIDDEILDHN